MISESEEFSLAHKIQLNKNDFNLQEVIKDVMSQCKSDAMPEEIGLCTDSVCGKSDAAIYNRKF